MPIVDVPAFMARLPEWDAKSRRTLRFTILTAVRTEEVSRKDMLCSEEDEVLDFNRSSWSTEVMAFGPLDVSPEDSILLPASAVASIQRVLMELLQAATAARPAQAVDLVRLSALLGNARTHLTTGLNS